MKKQRRDAGLKKSILGPQKETENGYYELTLKSKNTLKRSAIHYSTLSLGGHEDLRLTVKLTRA